MLPPVWQLLELLVRLTASRAGVETVNAAAAEAPAAFSARTRSA